MDTTQHVLPWALQNVGSAFGNVHRYEGRKPSAIFKRDSELHIGVIIAPIFMNLITLNRGEAIYIGADEAHAYLKGGDY